MVKPTFTDVIGARVVGAGVVGAWVVGAGVAGAEVGAGAGDDISVAIGAGVGDEVDAPAAAICAKDEPVHHVAPQLRQLPSLCWHHWL